MNLSNQSIVQPNEQTPLIASSSSLPAPTNNQGIVQPITDQLSGSTWFRYDFATRNLIYDIVYCILSFIILAVVLVGFGGLFYCATSVRSPSLLSTVSKYTGGEISFLATSSYNPNGTFLQITPVNYPNVEFAGKIISLYKKNQQNKLIFTNFVKLPSNKFVISGTVMEFFGNYVAVTMSDDGMKQYYAVNAAISKVPFPQRGIFRSTDSGKTTFQSKIFNSAGADVSTSDLLLNDIKTTANGKIVYAVAGRRDAIGQFIPKLKSHLFYSNDEGATFHEISFPKLSDSETFAGIETGYGGDFQKLAMSDDGIHIYIIHPGTGITRISDGVIYDSNAPAAYFSSIVCDTKGRKVLAVANDVDVLSNKGEWADAAGVYLSEDFGVSWRRIYNEKQLTYCAASGDLSEIAIVRGFVFSQSRDRSVGKILYSNNFGYDWSYVDSLVEDFTSIIYLKNLFLVADKSGEIFELASKHTENCIVLSNPKVIYEEIGIIIVCILLITIAKYYQAIAYDAYTLLFSYVEPETDIIISHDWGKKSEGYRNHERAKKLKNALEIGTIPLATPRRINIWFDEEKMFNDVRVAMTNAIRRSSCYVVAITKEYSEKVGKGSKNDNCFFELQQMNLDLIIPVVMDSEMKNPDNWSCILRAHVKSELFYDVSELNWDDPIAVEEAMNRLKLAIVNKIQHSRRVSVGTGPDPDPVVEIL